MDFWVIWLIILIFLIILEACTINLVSIWFIASSLVSLILSFFINSFFIQFAVFVILGIILLLTTRKILVNLLKPKNVSTNLDRVVGKEAIVTEPIKKNVIGEVKVDGKKWSAYSDASFEKGDTVKVISIDGVKLKVGKKE